MGLIQVLSLGVALGTDSFSVSVGIGVNRLGWRRVIKLSLLFSVMQVVLLWVGFYCTTYIDFLINQVGLGAGLDAAFVGEQIQGVFTWIGAAVLAGLGLNMLRCFLVGSEDTEAICYSGRLGLLLLAFSVSVDALTAGFGLGMVESSYLSWTALLVGVVIWAMAFVGLVLGRQINRHLGRKAQLCGGLLLLYLAVYFALGNLELVHGRV